MITLLHTSDWHLGASLDATPVRPSHKRFLDWLVLRLEHHPCDLLLVTGNIFHTSHPTPHDIRLLHDTLARLTTLPSSPTIVLLAGSHDSTALLEASSEILAALGIHTIADPSQTPGALVPIHRGGPEPVAIVAALPALRPLHLGVETLGSTPPALKDAIETTLGARFTALADKAAQTWPGTPLVAAAHLALEGVASSERFHPLLSADLTGGLDPSIFDPRFDYVALGHCRRPRSYNEGRVHYAGAPIPLTVDDVRWTPQVHHVAIDSPDSRAHTAVEVPSSQDILTLEGTPEALVSQLVSLSSPKPLAPLLVLRVRGEDLSRGVEAAFRGALARFPQRRRPRILRIEQPDESGEAPPSAALLLDPEAVFERLVTALEGEAPDDVLLGAFREAARLDEPT